jgi:hypothetical protein
MNHAEYFWDVLLVFTMAFTALLFMEWMLYYPEPIVSHLAP